MHCRRPGRAGSAAARCPYNDLVTGNDGRPSNRRTPPLREPPAAEKADGGPAGKTPSQPGPLAPLPTPSPAAPGGVEVTEPAITLLGEPAQPPPVDLWRPAIDAGLPAILDHAAVTWRHPARRARWELATASLHGFRAALDELGFTEIQTPKLVSSATESGATVFGVDYFGRPAYLAQSPQFYKQTMVGVFERVYETGPVFRAEPHDTARHLAEYTSLDAELGFIRDHRDVLAVLRHALAAMTAAVRDEAGAAVELLTVTVPHGRAGIPALHFRE